LMFLLTIDWSCFTLIEFQVQRQLQIQQQRLAGSIDSNPEAKTRQPSPG
jgi:hypothetical protein